MRTHASRLLFIAATVFFVVRAPDARASFATHVVSSIGLAGTGLYNDPAAVLGAPTTEYVDNFSVGAARGTYRTAMVGGAFNRTPGGQKVVTSIASGTSLTVGFANRVYDDPLNPFGRDLIVFGNSFFTTSTAYTPASNMETTRLGGGAFTEPGVSVSVAQAVDGPWHTFAAPADQFFPTQAYRWDRGADTWGALMDFTRPVDPSLSISNFASGTSVADAIDLYDGSGGGTSYDLAGSGFSWVRYVRFTHTGVGPVGDIDAVADVSPVPEPAVGLTLGVLSAAALLHRRRRAAVPGGGGSQDGGEGNEDRGSRMEDGAGRSAPSSVLHPPPSSCPREKSDDGGWRIARRSPRHPPSSILHPRPPYARAFTIVELLVVIGITALLLAILLPSLRAARQQAMTTKCLSNLRQLATAAYAYANDHDGSFPIAQHYVDDGAGGGTWHAWDYALTFLPDFSMTREPGLLWAGQGVTEVQQCPLYQGTGPYDTDPFTGYNYNTSYLGHGQGEAIEQPAKLSQVRAPSRTALFGDGQWGGGANKFMRAPFPNPGDATFSGRFAGTQGFRHHRARTNVAFVDGHAETLHERFAESDPWEVPNIASGTGFLSGDNGLYDLE